MDKSSDIGVSIIGRNLPPMMQATPDLLLLLSESKSVCDNVVLLQQMAVEYHNGWYEFCAMLLFKVFRYNDSLLKQLLKLEHFGLATRKSENKIAPDLHRRKTYTILTQLFFPHLARCLHEIIGYAPCQYAGESLENIGFGISKLFDCTLPRPITSSETNDNYMNCISDLWQTFEYGQIDHNDIDFNNGITAQTMKAEHAMDVFEIADELYYNHLESSSHGTSQFKLYCKEYHEMVIGIKSLSKKLVIPQSFETLNKRLQRLLKDANADQKEEKEDSSASDDCQMNDEDEYEDSSEEREMEDGGHSDTSSTHGTSSSEEEEDDSVYYSQMDDTQKRRAYPKYNLRRSKRRKMNNGNHNR
eukprot:127423_1